MPGYFSARPGWEQRLEAFVDDQQPGVNWFFVHDGMPEGAGYFVGYDRSSNRRVGFIGLSGFRSGPVPTNEWIPVRGPVMADDANWSSAQTWIVAGQVQRASRVIRSFRHAWSMCRPEIACDSLTSPPGPCGRSSRRRIRLNRWEFRRTRPGPPALRRGRSVIVVRTTRQIHVLNREHASTKVFTIPTEADRQSPVFWYEIGNGRALADFDRPWSTEGADNIARRMAYRIADDGTIVEQYDLALQSGMLKWSKQHEAMSLHIGLPAPAILLLIEPLFVMGIDQAKSYPAAVRAVLLSSWPGLMAVAALASVLAALAWRKSGAFGLPTREQVAWLVFVLLFGVPAYAGFLLHRRWPLREKCPNCQTQAPRDRGTCSECGIRFPDPALKGIEIFA